MKDILLLGATGSIGSQVLDIIRKRPQDFRLVAFSFGYNVEKAKAIIEEFKPELVVSPFAEALSQIKKSDILVDSNLLKVVEYPADNPWVINALVGSVGLSPSIRTLELNRPLLLANKESLVMGGALFTPFKEKGAIIVPIDSEHSALWQLLKTNQAKHLYITASGGALRDMPLAKLKDATALDCLNHPTWQMGPKITIDSATMMNKVFEIVEAYYLFGYSKDHISALIDRTSNVHALIELADGTVLAHMAPNDMHLPIEYAMDYPNGIDYNTNHLIYKDLKQAMRKLKLKTLDEKRYPLFSFAQTILTSEGFSGVIVNAVNEVLVEKFIMNEISFSTLIERLLSALERYQNHDLTYNLENIIELNDKILKEESQC